MSSAPVVARSRRRRSPPAGGRPAAPSAAPPAAPARAPRPRALDARERHGPVERQVVREPDLLDAAAAEQPLHQVAARDDRGRGGAPAARPAAVGQRARAGTASRRRAAALRRSGTTSRPASPPGWSHAAGAATPRRPSEPLRARHAVQRGQVLVVEGDARGGHVLLQVGQRRGAGDEQDVPILVQQPRQRDLGRRRCVLRGDGGDRRVLGKRLGPPVKGDPIGKKGT